MHAKLNEQLKQSGSEKDAAITAARDELEKQKAALAEAEAKHASEIQSLNAQLADANKQHAEASKKAADDAAAQQAALADAEKVRQSLKQQLDETHAQLDALNEALDGGAAAETSAASAASAPAPATSAGRVDRGTGKAKPARVGEVGVTMSAEGENVATANDEQARSRPAKQKPASVSSAADVSGAGHTGAHDETGAGAGGEAVAAARGKADAVRNRVLELQQQLRDTEKESATLRQQLDEASKKAADED